MSLRNERVRKTLIKEIADIDENITGAYNIRKNGKGGIKVWQFQEIP